MQENRDVMGKKIEKRFIIDTSENKEYMKNLCMELVEFGKKFPSLKGSSYYLKDDGTPWINRPRETWITSRMVHVYSIASMMDCDECDGKKQNQYKELARAGVKGLSKELYDEKSGGWYAGLTADGKILEGKQCYAHAFVILAASSAYLAGIYGSKKLLKQALKTYDKWFWNEEEGLACDAWDTDYSIMDDYRGLNANMHTVEAFLAAADALGNEKLRDRAGRIIDRVIGWAKDNNYRIPEHFSSDWMPNLDCNIDKPDDQFKPYGATPGHGIEWARLITEWAESTFTSETDTDLKEKSHYIEAAMNLYNRAISDAWNADGAPGIVYTTDWEGKPVVHDRMHWTLAEAINTSAVLFRITGDRKYAEDYGMFLEYLEEKVHDKENGSWFHQLDRNNNVLDTVWPGKPDLYHAFQATLIPYCDVKLSIAAAMRHF